MKLSRFILNSESATLAEVGVVDITLTIPANFTANAVRETVVPSPIKNALFRFYLDRGRELAVNRCPNRNQPNV